jgi:hypothetical protein
MSPLQWTERENDNIQKTNVRSANLSYGQVEALEKLIHTLEQDNREIASRPTAHTAEFRADQWSQGARLRAAHAIYGLSSLTEMRRVGVGAWIHRKYA